MAFHKTNLGSFGANIQTDMDGYIPEASDGPWDFAIDHGTQQTHNEDGSLTEYGEWWAEDGFAAWRDAAIAGAKSATEALDAWQANNDS